MGRFSDYLRELNPINGRWLAEDGEFVNLTGATTLFETLQSVETGQAQNITNSVLASNEVTTVLNTDRIVHIKRDATPGDIYSMAVQLVIW